MCRRSQNFAYFNARARAEGYALSRWKAVAGGGTHPFRYGLRGGGGHLPLDTVGGGGGGTSFL